MLTHFRSNFLISFLLLRGHTSMERQQVIIYNISVVLVVVGMSLHLLSVLGADNPVLMSLSIVFIAGAVFPYIFWLCHRVSLAAAFTTGCIILQAVQTAKIVYITTSLPAEYHFLVTANGVVALLLMVLLSMSYMRTGTIIVGAANVLSMLFAAIWLGDKWLWQFFVLCLLYAVFFAFLTDVMYRNVKHLQDENVAFRKGERTLLQILRLNRKEILAYIEMCRTDNPHDGDTDRLFSMLTEKSQRNVINAVERKNAMETARRADLKTLFPDFTPMELEVARLILEDRKLKQIMQLTGKNESNISTVRSHIRKKMGLSPAEDLRQALLKQVER